MNAKNAGKADCQFNFKFNLHKSLLPIGIDDHDLSRLSVVYGTDSEWLRKEAALIEQANARCAARLETQFNLSALTGKQAKIIFLGDSITSDRQSYLNILKQALSGSTGLKLVDLSISAQKSVDLFTGIYPDIIAQRADIAHIMIGTNDVRRIDDERRLYHTSPAEYEKNMDFVIGALIKGGSSVILSTIPPFSREKASRHFAGGYVLYLEEDRRLYNEILTQLAQKHHVVLNQMDEAYSKYTAEELTLDDGIHLNALGQELLACGVLQALAHQLHADEVLRAT